MKMRNVWVAILVLAFCFSMASCGNKDVTVSDTSVEVESVVGTESEKVSEAESVVATQAQSTAENTEAQTAEQNKDSAKSADNNSNSKKANNTSKSGGNATAQKPNNGGSNNGNLSGEQAKQDPPVATPQKENYDWSQAEVDALIAEAYAYGRTLGLEPATNLTPSNSSWNQPVCTWLGKQNTIDGVKGEIRHLKWLLDRDGLDPTGIPCYQIYAERYCEVNAGGVWCWQFYVMY